MNARALLGILCIVSLLALSGCGGATNNNTYKNDYAKYFTGKEGAEAKFVNLPTQLYYYGPDDNSGNEFAFGVEVQNKGASFSRGGIYVSGYDPRMIVIDEIPIVGNVQGACGIGIGTIAFGQIGGIFRCDGVEVSGNENFGNVRLDLSKLIGDFDQKYGKSWWVPSKFNFEYNNNGNNWMISTDRMNAEYYQHGRLFLAWTMSVDFLKYYGREFFLAGDTYDYPGGEYSYYTYNGRIANWPLGLDETDQSFLLSTCYFYTTFASPIVCVDPEPMSENRKVCQPQSRAYNGGNGAPVAITSIEQENTPRKIIFHINVKNIGGGTVYDPGWLEKCSPYYPGRLTPEEKNVVLLGDVRIGSMGLDSRGGSGGITCSPEVIRLDPKTGTGSTTCTYPLEFTNTKSAYQTPLTVELWYGYGKTEERKIRVKRVI